AGPRPAALSVTGVARAIGGRWWLARPGRRGSWAAGGGWPRRSAARYSRGGGAPGRARPGTGPEGGRIGAYQTGLVGTDGSDSSYRAVDRAAEIARDTTARLVIVCAYEPATPREVAAAGDVLKDEAFSVVGSAPAEETLRTAAERAAARGAGKIERV